MSGMINGPADNTGAAQDPLSDSVLAAAEQHIEQNLSADPANKQNYLKIVVAGMHAALARGPDGILGLLAKSKDPVSDAAKGAVGLVLILRREAKGAMPLKAMIPAAMTLMLRALDLVNRNGWAQVGTPELVRATHIFANSMFRSFGITPGMLASASQRVHSLTQDPVAMAKINMKAGITQHPLAANPTPLPPS